MSDDWPMRMARSVVAAAEAREAQRRARVGAVSERTAPILTAQDRRRADLHALLDACLDLAPEVDPLVGDAQALARGIGRILFRDALGWTEPREPTTATDWQTLEGDPSAWRQEVWWRLHRAPHLLPDRLMAALGEALLALNKGDGMTPPLMKPAAKDGGGRNPREARELEQWMLRWIAWRSGKGAKVGDLTVEVASAVGRTTKAVEAWRAEWQARCGKNEVTAELERYRADPEYIRLMEGSGLTLHDMAALWREARAPEKAR